MTNTLGIKRLSSERSANAAFHRSDTDWAFENDIMQGSNRFNYQSNSQHHLTTHVWPKSRMLFAIVSKMSKEGVVNER